MNVKALMAAAAISLLSSSGYASAEQISLNVTATPSIFRPMFVKLVKIFEYQNPDIKINLDASKREQKDLIQDLLRSAVTGGMPDVSFQGYNYIRTLVDHNLAVPLGPFIKRDADWTIKKFTKSVTSSASLNGKVYGLGVGMSFPIIYYNPKLLKKAGYVGTNLPTTWSKMITLAGKINKVNSNGLGLYIRIHPWIFQSLIESQGGHLMDINERKITFSGTEGLAAFKLISQIGKAGQAAKNLTRAQVRQAFAAGTVGMLVDSSSSLASFEKNVGGLFQVKTAPLPRLSDNARVPAAGIASVMITKDAKHQDAAWKFMKFVSSSEGQVIVGTETGYAPANGIPIKRPALLGNYYSKHPAMQAALDTLPIASLWYTFPGDNGLKINTIIQDAMDRVVTLKDQPKPALKTLSDKVEELLAY